MIRLQLNWSKIIVILSLMVMFGCKHAEKVVVPERKIKRLGVSRVIRLVEDNGLKYNTLNVGRVNVSFEKENKTTSIKGSYKISKDSVIQVSAQKLAIPVGKLEANPDSFTAVYHLEKEVYQGSYNFISELIGSDVDFNIIQSVLGFQLYSFKQTEDEKDFRDYYIDIVDEMYKISSLHDRKLRKLEKNEDKLGRLKNRLSDRHLMKQDIFVDPDMFVIRKMVFDDLEVERVLTIEFSEFSQINQQFFPGNIRLTISGSENMVLNIQLSRITIDEPANFGFNIPERYSRKHLK
jgi:hypothetical protein